MNPLIQTWFRKVDICPEIVNEAGLDMFGESWSKRFWKVAYHDARMRARIFEHSLIELKEFRNLGVLKQIWASTGNCIGRIRVDNLSEFDNNTIANEFGFKDYNPNRILNT